MGMYMENLEHMLCGELDKIAQQGELSAGSLDAVDKLTHSIKSIKAIEAMDDGYSNAYSGQRRDSMGRYTSNAYGTSNTYGRGNSRGYSRDGEKDKVLAKLDELRMSVEQMEE